MPDTKAHNVPAAPLILVVDDDSAQRSLLESFLAKQGFHIITASTGEEALDLLNTQEISMMISDVRMPGMSGLEALRKARTKRVALPVLMVTAYPDIRDAVGAIQGGAINYLEKPIDLEELLVSVRRAIGMDIPDKAPASEPLVLPEGVIAESRQMRDVIREIAYVAPTETRVLITGESGVGKEVVADLIHAASLRANGPHVKVNCAAIPESLLESELFGHEKGAFTGATSLRVGRFEEANGGTIFLDEIAELSPALQAKLLRITQDGTFERVGSNRVHHTDARILASTNRNLDREVEKGKFREDLFFRLNVFEIYVPPLREHPEDIIPLATFFAAQFSKGKPRLSPSVTACLELYQWPGNIRELKNAMERATLMARGEMILPEHLPTRIRKGEIETTEAKVAEPSSGKRMEEVERNVILETLREKNYNRTETARTLGISRRALLYKLKRFSEQGHDVPEGS
jgi:DNA-binding NtrC family response regulator